MAWSRHHPFERSNSCMEILQQRILFSYPLYESSQAGNGAVVNAHVFYNNSKLDGNDPAANENDDRAIDSQKVYLLPGHEPGPQNITGYSKGLNGVMVDIAGLPTGATLSPDDFGFR